MNPMAWWLPALGITLLAVVWTAWRLRPRRPADAHEAMEGLDRMREAMNRPLPDRRPGRADGGPDTLPPVPRLVPGTTSNVRTSNSRASDGTSNDPRPFGSSSTQGTSN